MAKVEFQDGDSNTISSCCQNCFSSTLAKLHVLLNRSFYFLGRSVSKNKGYYILIPLFLTTLALTGFQRLKYEDDPEYLFAPTNGAAKRERSVVEENFSLNFTELFDPSRITRSGRFAKFIITAKDGGTILRESIWKDIVKLDKIVKSIVVRDEKRLYYYPDLCAIKEKECFKNDILGLKDVIKDVENGTFQIQYPINLEPFVIPHFFGGLQTDEKKEVVEFDLIEAARFTSTTVEDELEKNTNSVKPFVAVTLTIMITFSGVACVMGDWVRGKPMIGVIGVITSVLSSFAAFGLLVYIGVPFIGINMAAPFLMLGIGIDDSFVMLAAWRRTRIQDPVPERLAQTYAEAAVSITITSLTDMISFFIGVITPFPSVQIFCIYTVDFYTLEDKYFRVYPYSIQVVITGNVTYSDEETKKDILDLMKKFEDLPYIDGEYTQSVIRYWYSFLEENAEWLDFNITDEKSFITYLREVYVSDPSDVLNLDIKYNEDYSRILATSVDFSAHISYAYLTAKVDTPNERVKECLFTLGLPIIQGGISTIIGVIALTFAPSYIFLTFFKIVFLVIFFGIMHGIFLLPVLLSLLGPGSFQKKKEPRLYNPHQILNQKNDLQGTKLTDIANKSLPKEFGLTTKEKSDKVILQSGAFLAPGKPASDKYSDSHDKDMGLGTSGEDSNEGSLQDMEDNQSGRGLSVIEVRPSKTRAHMFLLRQIFSSFNFLLSGVTLRYFAFPGRMCLCPTILGERYPPEVSLKKSEEFYHLMNNRRTLRYFSSDDVDQSIIENLIRTSGE
ncbi:Patched domain-containing protein 4 [Armadillidium nasatum]|uniref:Patched domain-containing protein 4 n=1 Tax=Armadillidium nasatum TaxID=96803 RepID=A0A5N5T826_9CRUS|nr:Patched domain-containing protein 4 [Armadillidium nasatum]